MSGFLSTWVSVLSNGVGLLRGFLKIRPPPFLSSHISSCIFKRLQYMLVAEKYPPLTCVTKYRNITIRLCWMFIWSWKSVNTLANLLEKTFFNTFLWTGTQMRRHYCTPAAHTCVGWLLCVQLYIGIGQAVKSFWRRKKHFVHLAAFWFGIFEMLFRAARSLVGHENTWRRIVHRYNGL